MLLNNLLLISILFFSTLNIEPTEKNIFISPLKIPLAFSSNFGELRINHFHSGLDLKTQGATGKEVVAAADGYVYRISVSPGGFGKALYIKHQSGYSTVYGHLDRFIPEIEKYVTEKQYENQSFMVTLFPQKDDFPVKKGDLIAYSGNSGSSGGPHLHYEIRKSETEIPVNPLMFDFGASDKIKPVIERLAIYPIESNSSVNRSNKMKKIAVTGSEGNYYISSENAIKVSGLTGFGIKTYDLMSNSNRGAVYSINLTIDSISVYKYVMDEFSFSESRFINSHIDYETYMRENVYYERMYVLPNDKLSAYKDSKNRGLFNFDDNRIHRVEVVVTDIRNNISKLSFNVRSEVLDNIPKIAANPSGKVKVMPYNRTNRFTDENIIVNIPSGSLYDTLDFNYKKTPGTVDMLSDVHLVHNKYTPLHKPYTLSIKPQRVIPGKESKMLIAEITDDMKKIAMTTTWDDKYLKSEVSTFGKYFVGIDTIPPGISATSLTQNADLTGRKEIRLRITDDFSGIKSYEPAIDGKWALFEYDPKNNMLIYKFDSNRVTKGTKHNLTLIVSDNVDNKSILSYNFTW